MTFRLNTSIRHLPFYVAAVLGGALCGCSSAPIHYYTLVPIKDTASNPNASLADILVDRVSMPPQVDRSQLVIRQGNNGLVILETQWWGANLTDEFRNALVNQLPPLGTSTSKRTKLHLTLEVQRFDSVPGHYALLEARWRLRNREADVRMECHTTLSTPSGNTIEGLVSAHQTNITKLSSLIEAAGRKGKC